MEKKMEHWLKEVISMRACHVKMKILRALAILLLVCAYHAHPALAQVARVDTILSIGLTDGPEDYLFARPVGVAPGPGNTIVVLEAEYRTVRLYDSLGSFVRRIGRAGEGPGEFVNPLRLTVRDSTIYVTDFSGRFTAFSTSGRYLYDQTLPRIAGLPARDLIPLRHEHTFMARAGLYSNRETDNRYILVLARGGTGAVDTLSAHHAGTVLYRQPPPALQMLNPGAIPIAPEVVWAVAGDSLVVLVDGYRGEVRWLSVTPTGLAQRAVRSLSWNPQPFRSTDVNEVRDRVLARLPFVVIEELILPPFLGRAWRAVVDDRGRVWINLFEGLDVTNRWLIVPPDTNEATREVSLPDGYYLNVVENGRLYGTTRTALGVPVVQILGLDLEDPEWAPTPFL